MDNLLDSRIYSELCRTLIAHPHAVVEFERPPHTCINTRYLYRDVERLVS